MGDFGADRGSRHRLKPHGWRLKNGYYAVTGKALLLSGTAAIPGKEHWSIVEVERRSRLPSSGVAPASPFLHPLTPFLRLTSLEGAVNAGLTLIFIHPSHSLTAFRKNKATHDPHSLPQRQHYTITKAKTDCHDGFSEPTDQSLLPPLFASDRFRPNMDVLQSIEHNNLPVRPCSRNECHFQLCRRTSRFCNLEYDSWPNDLWRQRSPVHHSRIW